MIKRFVILRRKPDMSVEKFRYYWEHIHGPLVAKIPGLIQYVQYHVRSEISDNTDDPIDGIAELWFESEQAQKKAYETPEYQAVAKDDIVFFNIDAHHVHAVMTEKIVKLK